MRRQPIENMTLYAELLEQLQGLERVRSIGFLDGSFVTKSIKGEEYVYFQHYEPGGKKSQLYLGRKSMETDRLMKSYREEHESYAHDMTHINRLSAQLRAGGALVTDHASARVIKRFAESGVFQLGGILVGTHAYIVLGNMLGVIWEQAAVRTRDIDIASPSTMGIALPQTDADIPKAIESLKMGFFPIPQLNHKHPSTSFMVRQSHLRVDLLTPLKNKTEDPVYIPRFKTAAQPLKFLWYLLEGAVPAVVVDGGGVLVNVPSPARFGIHKLIVAQERTANEHAKKGKDMLQAFNVLSFLQEERPGDVLIAMEEALAQGPGWRKRIVAGLKELARKFDWSLELDVPGLDRPT